MDVIVIGSGLGGMNTAAAFSRLNHRVLLREQAPMIDGLTHALSPNGFTWDVGQPGRRPDIVTRFGYGLALPNSARRPLDAVLA